MLCRGDVEEQQHLAQALLESTVELNDPSARAAELVGTWLHGSKPNKYCIVQDANGSLHFDGPNPAGGRLVGVLTPQGIDFEAELKCSDGAVFGAMSFSMRAEDGT